ncbi:heterokaryon incompatibility protein-domain-containing protein [Halenospora varia]|nr:heterokaryon incompatibility protein-domain-containing protein [Halenospora varia]
MTPKGEVELSDDFDFLDVSSSDEESRPEPACKVCHQLQECLCLSVSQRGGEIIGTLKEVRSLECTQHLPIIKFDHPKVKALPETDSLYLEKARFDPFINICYGTTKQRTLKFSWKPNTKIKFAILGVAASPKQVGVAKELDPHWTDVQLLSDWKSKCHDSHKDDCHASRVSSAQSEVRPRLLIDTVQRCLVRSFQGVSYIALSYVWGQASTLKTVKANVDTFMEENALSRGEYLSQIPKTIQDAMNLVGVLQERYLWVDALCIVQDTDWESLQLQLNDMALVYANASLTIVAADGIDSNHGLRGLRGLSTEPRNALQTLYPLSDDMKVLMKANRHIRQSIWYSRGWAFQEGLFARKRLVFFEGMVQWQCPSTTWREDFDSTGNLNSDLDSTQNRQSQQNLLSRKVPDLRGYQSLVGFYNLKDLTFKSDIIRAFDGLAGALSRTYEGGFLWGLPEMFFDVTILWRIHTLGTGKSRDAKGPVRRVCEDFEVGKTGPPSWSWMGWYGSLDSQSWDAGMRHQLSDPLDYSALPTYSNEEFIKPTVQWCSVEKPGANSRPINSSWLRYEHGIDDEDCARLGYVKHQHFKQDEQGRYHFWKVDNSKSGATFRHDFPFYFTHSSDPRREFRYPLPIHDPQSAPTIPIQHKFLNCRTQRAFLFSAEKILRATPRDGSYAFALLRNSSDTWIGSLFLSVEEVDKGEDTSKRREKIELIKVSEGSENNYEAKKDGNTWMPGSVLEEYQRVGFVNVLWIEWVDGIAYRKGIGKVLKAMWEELGLEEVDVILG